MKILRWILGFLFMMIIMVVTIVLFARSSMLNFIDMPSLVLVLVCPFGLILIQYGPSRMGRYFSVALSGRPAEKETAKKAEYFFRKWGHYFLLTGGIYFITGLIMVLSHIQDKEAVGANLAVSLITLLYGMLLDLLMTQPLAVFCREKVMDDETV